MSQQYETFVLIRLKYSEFTVNIFKRKKFTLKNFLYITSVELTSHECILSHVEMIKGYGMSDGSQNRCCTLSVNVKVEYLHLSATYAMKYCNVKCRKK